MSQIRSIYKQHRHRDQKSEEVWQIILPNAVCQPYAMVIVPSDTCLANAAMLTSRWLWKAASVTYVAWVKKNSVKRVKLHLLLVIFRRNRRFRYGCLIEKGIRKHNSNRGTNPMYRFESRPCFREKHNL